MQDEERLKLISDDYENGYRLLIRQYSDLVYTIVYSKLASLCSKEDMEECAADVFIQFHKSISTFDASRGSLKAFLSIVAKRTAINRFHELTKSSKDLVSIDGEEGLPADLISEDDLNEDRETLIDAIRKLEDPDRTIIVKKYFGGKTAKQISKDIGMKEFEVHKRISRALIKLKKILEEVGYYE